MYDTWAYFEVRIVAYSGDAQIASPEYAKNLNLKKNLHSLFDLNYTVRVQSVRTVPYVWHSLAVHACTEYDDREMIQSCTKIEQSQESGWKKRPDTTL